MKKLILSFVLIHLSLSSMEKSPFELFKISLSNAVNACNLITNNDECFEQWQKNYDYLYNKLPNNQQEIDTWIEQENNVKHPHPVFLFLAHLKIKNLKPKKSLFNKSKKDIELTTVPLTNEELNQLVLETAEKYKIVLPHTPFVKQIWENKLQIESYRIRYTQIQKKKISIFEGNDFSIQPSQVDLHYLSLLPKKFQVPIGYFDKLSLTKVPEDVCNLKQLKSLNLAQNNLTDLPESLSNLKLKILALVGNKLKQIPPVVGKIKSLETLSVDGNMIDKDPQDIISQLKNLKNLSLTHNKLSSFDLLEFPPLLESLKLEHNQLNELPAIPESSQLEYLTFDQNPLKKDKLPYNNLSTLPCLKKYIDHEGRVIKIERPTKKAEEKE